MPGVGSFNSEVVHSRLDVRPYLSARRRQAFITGLIPSEEHATVQRLRERASFAAQALQYRWTT
jgi:hypothetical protein